MYRINDLSLPLDFDRNNLAIYVSNKLKNIRVTNCRLIRLSIDARHKPDVKYVSSIAFDVEGKFDMTKFKNVDKYVEYEYHQKVWSGEKQNICVVGSGPSGLFTALELTKSGCPVTIIERGYDMNDRQRVVDLMMNDGILDTISNIQFGLGGAGTFSDGKLNTGIKSEYISRVLRTFVEFGADENILYDSRPHVGTDQLSRVIVNIRDFLISKGCKFLFEHKFERVNLVGGKVTSIIVSHQGEEHSMPCDQLILAIGHSSRDTIRYLRSIGVELIKKPFSMGVRIEHLQQDINKSQYGIESPFLPPADYHLSEHLDNGHSIYTFCMCPGGVVVPAMSEKGTIVTNGMSYHSRSGINSNSALLVDVRAEDFGGEDVLSGIELQEKYEQIAYRANNSYFATVQKVGDFLSGKPTTSLGRVQPSYKPGVTLGTIDGLLPKFIIDSLRLGIPRLDRKLKGFADPDALLTGIETRSSAPYQVVRDEYMQGTYRGLYMIGEGAGFAGGIVSSAVEGIKCARIVIDRAKN